MTCSIKTRMRITLDLYFFHFSDWPVDVMASKAGGGAASIAAAAMDRPEVTEKLRRVTEPLLFCVGLRNLGASTQKGGCHAKGLENTK